MPKSCISCGMDMTESKDFANSDESKDYCSYCADEKGNLRSYDEVLANWSNFIMTTHGITKDEAIDMASSYMAKLPAWKDHI
jgi:hypothetical protein